MSKSQAQPQDSIAPDQDADLLDVVRDLRSRLIDAEETIDELEATVESQQDTIDDLRDELQEERETRAKADAEQRQRITDIEEAGSDDANPTPDAEKPQDKTPIERLSEGDQDDVAAHVTPSVERAVTLFENLANWGKETPKGTTLRPADKPKDLLEAARDESLAWQQYYRACEALERLSRGAVTFFDHQRHGKTLVLHEDTAVHDRLRTASTGQSQPSLVAD